MQTREKENRRDWIIVLLILLFGLLCILLASGWALRLTPSWRLDSNMESNLDPNSEFLTRRPSGFVEPLDPSILTQPVWYNIFLTPGAIFPTNSLPSSPTLIAQVSHTPMPAVIASVTNTGLPTVIPTNTLSYFPTSPANTPKPPPTNTPIPSADLAITKDDGNPSYLAGGTVTYTIAVVNNGPNNVIGAVVTDNKPVLITSWSWVCASQTNGATGCDAVTNSNTNFSDTVNLPNGAGITYTVTANISISAVGALTNAAAIAVPAGYSDPVAGNNSATDTDTLTTLNADLSITKDDGLATVNPGDVITYTVRVTNNGPINVTGAVLRDAFAGGLSKSAVACSSNPGQCVTAPTIVQLESGTFALPALNNGQFYEIVITANVTATGGSITNTATVNAPAGINDPTSGNNTAPDTDTVNLVADLGITITDNSTVYTANVVKIYEITVSNAGPSDVVGATVTNVFSNGNVDPSSVVWICIPSGGAVCALAGAGNLSNEPINLNSGSSVTFYLTALTVPAPLGDLVNTAAVAVPGGVTDPGPNPNSASDTDQLFLSSGTTYGNIGIGPDGGIENLNAGDSIILTLSSSITVDGSHGGADLIYYEQDIGGIAMDWIILEVSDGSNWYPILNWGDGFGNTGTNIDLPLPVPPNLTDCSGEPDNCLIDASLLAGGSGVTIDLDALSPAIIPAGTVVSYIRITVPPGGVDAGVGIDGIYVVP